MKVPIIVTAIAGGLTLAAWVFFYIMTPEVPLGLRATTVVGVFFLIVVTVIRRLWLKIRKKKGQEE